MTLQKTMQTTQRDLEFLSDKRVAVVGYGSQGRAHSLNMRDSGVDVVLGLRPEGASWQQALQDGWEPMTVEQAVQGADLVCLLLPDMQQPKVFKEQVAPNLKSGAGIMFAHGFNVLYGSIQVPSGHDVLLCAPKGPGSIVRREYTQGGGVPCLIAIDRDDSGQGYQACLAYAQAIGCGRAGVLQTTFQEETETDLFGEQAVLCGGLGDLIKAGWETLVEAGYSPEVAYFECLHETKLIVDLIYEGGLAGMHQFISDTAKYGALTAGPRVITEQTREAMKSLLTDIQSGKFAKQWQSEFDSGEQNYRQMLKQELQHDIEEVGKNLRKHFAWLNPPQPSANPQPSTPSTQASEKEFAGSHAP